MWKNILENFNGKCFFIDQVWISSDKLQLRQGTSVMRLFFNRIGFMVNGMKNGLHTIIC